MRRNRTDEEFFRDVAVRLGISASEARRAVHSFFDNIVLSSRKLPFDNCGRIYTKNVFESMRNVWQIPYIGRIGPVYSRYLRWRENESKDTGQVPRSRYRSRLSQNDIENMAEDILSGRTPSPVTKRKGNELYHRVWLVGQDGKKLARQVIPKKQD